MKNVRPRNPGTSVADKRNYLNATVDTSQPALIDLALEHARKIKAPLLEIERRYTEWLEASNPRSLLASGDSRSTDIQATFRTTPPRVFCDGVARGNRSLSLLNKRIWVQPGSPSTKVRPNHYTPDDWAINRANRATGMFGASGTISSSVQTMRDECCLGGCDQSRLPSPNAAPSKPRLYRSSPYGKHCP